MVRSASDPDAQSSGQWSSAGEGPFRTQVPEWRHRIRGIVTTHSVLLFPLELMPPFTYPSFLFDCSSCRVDGCLKLDKIFIRSRCFAGPFSR